MLVQELIKTAEQEEKIRRKPFLVGIDFILPSSEAASLLPSPFVFLLSVWKAEVLSLLATCSVMEGASSFTRSLHGFLSVFLFMFLIQSCVFFCWELSTGTYLVKEITLDYDRVRVLSIGNITNLFRMAFRDKISMKIFFVCNYVLVSGTSMYIT